MSPPQKHKRKLLKPEKVKRKLLTPSRMQTETDGQTDRGNTICPFHHSSKGGGIKKKQSYGKCPKISNKIK